MLEKPTTNKTQFPIESLLSARLLLEPQIEGDRIYFLSDLAGTLSLYSIARDGSIPQPLLPGGLALVNPHIMPGDNFHVLPKLGKVLVMIDKLGDENYQPNLIPLSGGILEPLFGDKYRGEQIACVNCDKEKNIAYFFRDNRKTPDIECLKVNLETGEVTSLGTSIYGNACNGVSSDHSTVILADGYTAGDVVLYYWKEGMTARKLLYGVPLDQRDGKQVPLTGIGWCSFVDNNKGLFFESNIFHDDGGLTYLSIDDPSKPVDVPIKGLRHSGQGEMTGVRRVKGDVFVLEYNIDGASWAYEGRFHSGTPPTFEVERVLIGNPPLSDGVALGLEWQIKNEIPLQAEYVFSFTRANSPSQIYHIPTGEKVIAKRLSSEKVLGIPDEYLSAGEDASYTSFDGLRVSARLYLPSSKLGYKGPRPLVEYVHGGPQGQERPDFSWFSMPLIQYLTLNGFAVFVPNVRGSTGYGLSYTKWVDRDFGGKDRLDHVHAMTQVLPQDKRVDVKRAGVVGRSYGGYMTLTQAARHPELWSAAVDMFGPYDLITFSQRIPESWKPYFELVIGHPERDREFLLERSPRTYMQQIRCPLLVIQGKNDSRIIERVSRDVVEQLQAAGKQVDYLVFEDEGHDVLKYANRVTCYTAIAEFFKKYL